MNVQRAADITLSLAGNVNAVRDENDGSTVEHAMWMLEGIRLGYIQHEKAHRWLGYAQGVLVRSQKTSLHDVKLANRRSKS